MKTILSLCLFAGAALATPVTLSSGGPLPDQSIGPYTLLIDGSYVPAMCFDDLDSVFVGETWNANLLSIGQAAAVTGDSLVTLYAEVWLYNAILGFSVTPPEETAIQDAAWGLADHNAPTDALVQSYEVSAVRAALAGLPGLDLSAYAIVEPMTGNPQRVQTFVTELGSHSIGDVPETGTLAGAGMGLLWLGLIRRRGYGTLSLPGVWRKPG